MVTTLDYTSNGTVTIEGSPTDLFDSVARQLCAVCGGIARKSIETGDIGPRNTMLQLNCTSIDVWKCPRCRAHFAWHEPKLVRMDLRSERCLHAILQHDGASLADELVREFLGLGEDVVQAILRYARERDEDLLRKLTRRSR